MALDPRLFSLLGIYNGPWTPLRGYSSLNPIVNGTDTNTGHDNITLTGGLLNLNVTVNGLSGNDFIDSRNVGLVNFLNGGAGNDQIYGGPGINTINGGDGNDYVMGGGGADILNGGAGIDTLSYESATGGGITLTLNASGGVNIGQFLPGRSNAGIDVIGGGFENVVGTNQDDTITGNASGNTLLGLNGNDTLFGMAGNDTLVGGGGADALNGGDDGNDTASYVTSLVGVTVNLDTGINSGGEAQGDTLNSIENITGSNFNDVITGNSDDNVLIGGAGADTLSGGAEVGWATYWSKDIFAYVNVTDSTPGAADSIIMDGGDRIDLNVIDANGIAGDGNQAFVRVASFTGVRGQLTSESGLIEVDINGDMVADMAIGYENIHGGVIVPMINL